MRCGLSAEVSIRCHRVEFELRLTTGQVITGVIAQEEVLSSRLGLESVPVFRGQPSPQERALTMAVTALAYRMGRG